MQDRTIAILGAGGAGCCAALELAERGYQVHLFERREEAVLEASLANEGKIHLGLIYAMDRSLRTARTMIDGALLFQHYLQRWVPFSAADMLSTPFYYAVHEASLQGPEELQAHYERCSEYFAERRGQTGLDYLGTGENLHCRRLAEGELPGGLDPQYFPVVFATNEYAVDPGLVAALLRAGIADHPAIHFHPGHEVTSVQDMPDGRLQVSLADGERVRSETFARVVNTCWYRRLPLDRPLGITPPGAWSHRYKFANRIRVPLQPNDLLSVTGVQGPFGDLVNFGEQGLFLSWYPTGRTGLSLEESPPEWDASYSREQRMAIFQRSLHAWGLRCSDLGRINFEDADVDPIGGVIYALGTTDVDDDASRLHDRFEVGIQSRGNYHSVDTGKYTLIPAMAVAIADRVEGLR